jgi:hypothetical protein
MIIPMVCALIFCAYKFESCSSYIEMLVWFCLSMLLFAAIIVWPAI